MHNIRLINQRGQTLPFTLFLVGILTSTVSVVGYSIVKERKFIMEDKKRLDASYASESGQQFGKAQIRKYVTESLTQYVTGINAANMSNCLLGNTTAQRDGFLNGDGSWAGINFTPDEQVFMDKINSLFSIRKPVKYKTFLFNDKNGNKQKDAGEEGFKWLSYNNTTNSEQVVQTNNFSYNITSYGYFDVGNGNYVTKKMNSTGQMSIQIGRGSFSKYALFTNVHLDESGNKVWFTENTSFQGPVHTNGESGSTFNFMGNPGPSFTDVVTSGTNDITWYNTSGQRNGSTLTKTYTTGSYSQLTNVSGSTTRDKATFQSKITIGASKESLPTNALSQSKAAMGGDATDTSALSASQQTTLLGLPSGTTSIPNNIYVPNNSTSTTGGIYVKGDVDSLTMGVDSGNNQIYTIVQTVGTQRTTKTITINRTSNQTSVATTVFNTSNSTTTSSTTNLSGIPKGTIHVDGAINSLGGPQRVNGVAGSAIQKDNALTISATGDIVVNRDIKYQVDPRGNDGVFGTSDDKMDAKNVLGLFSSGGDVRIGSSMPNDAHLHATVMASSSGGTFKVDGHNDTGKGYRGTFNLLGGAVTDRYGAFGLTDMTAGYTRKFNYDKRMLERNVSPPFFPATSKYSPIDSGSFNLSDWNEQTVNNWNP